jgi:hypothetical protein
MFYKIIPLHANDGDHVKTLNTHKQILSHGHIYELANKSQMVIKVKHVIFAT